MRVGTQLREKVVELFVRVEHLTALEAASHLAFFGMLSQLAGQCCAHLAEGRRAEALKTARLMSATMWAGLPEGPEQDTVREALEEIVAVLEHPDEPALH